MADRETLRDHSLNRRFAVGATEITRRNFNAFAAETFAVSDNRPANNVTYYDACAYCNWLSAQEGIAEDQWCYQPNTEGKYASGMMVRGGFEKLSGYRLPTEEEWEYACRAGSHTKYNWGNDELAAPHYSHYRASDLIAVAQKIPNGFGLYDTHGNVAEWCHELATFPIIADASWQAIRGCAFGSTGAHESAAKRHFRHPIDLGKWYGFRCVRTLPAR